MRPWKIHGRAFERFDLGALGSVIAIERQWALQISHWKLKGIGYWAVDEMRTSEFVGCAGLWQSAGWPEPELGYWLVKEHQGKGYALQNDRREAIILRLG